MLTQSISIFLQVPFIALVLQSMDQDARKELTPLKLREKAAKFAKETVNIQMKSFKVTPCSHLYVHLKC